MVVKPLALLGLLAIINFATIAVANLDKLKVCEKICKASGLKADDEKYCLKQCIIKIRTANQPRVIVREISTGVFNISWNGPTITSSNRWKFDNLTYHIYIRQVSGHEFKEHEATLWVETATNTTKWMTAKGARPGIWYQFKVTATIYEANRESKIWEAISTPMITRAVGKSPEKPTKISARQYRKANTTLSNVEVTFHRPRSSDYQIITYRLRLRCMPRIIDVNKVLLIQEHRKKIKAKLSSDPHIALFKNLPIGSVCQAKIQSIAAWGSKRFKSKVAKFCFFIWPHGTNKSHEKIRLHNLCHTKVKASAPVILSNTIYPMRYGNYSLSLVWMAPENSERIHIYSYHVRWTVIPKNANYHSKNYYNNSAFVESHDIALRRHIYDDVSNFYGYNDGVTTKFIVIFSR
ncbi:uncharacterized protein TRIADDRAFT_57800 [Trichoplax adhaerens]|uniref:Fibronectin type-III domain-containing protein n=1 Tax=Trichoplax adhaerens TaxID=10228 RepID=B3S1E4_TRIAD|nr:predicted protein [Trichoplax adhaerens]EDV22992.1 predicted protein [Trichoplax adhaerens]|eukprot:XP_002113902.1 predicted protein [Trichoplax adhaerens]